MYDNFLIHQSVLKNVSVATSFISNWYNTLLNTFIFQWILSDEAKKITGFEMWDLGSRLWL